MPKRRFDERKRVVDDFSQVEPEEPKKKKAALLVSGVTTAASLLAEQENGVRRYPPSMFKHGMTVEHREYGLGTILSLSGEGAKRRATVRFSSPTGEKTFVLLHANLQPVE